MEIKTSNSKTSLSLLPMDLAESGTTPVAQRVSPFSTLCRRLSAIWANTVCKIAFVLLVATIAVVVIIKFLSKNENMTDIQKTQVLIVTGARQPINETSAPTDMAVFLQIKDKMSNKTFSSASRRKRSSNKKKTLRVRSIFENPAVRQFDIPKARQIIIDHDEVCSPENKNEFCKNILRKLNVSIFDENDNPTDMRTFRNTNFYESGNDISVTSDKGRFTNPIGNTMDGQYPGQHPMNVQLPTTISDLDHDVSERDMSLHGSSLSNDPKYYSQSYPYQPAQSYGPVHPPHTGDCLMSRLLNKYNIGPAGPMNYYYGGQSNPYLAPVNAYNRPSYPYTAPAYINPFLYNRPYTSYQPAWPSSREASPTAFDRSLHPQDVGISMHFKDSLSSPSPVFNLSSYARISSCPVGTKACTSGDTCVEDENWCDGFVDCVDASDEVSCTCQSRVDSSRLCDGYYDCPFGEDEMGCFGCNPQAFSCDDVNKLSKSTCFMKEQRCNNIIDCPNHKDETECNMLAPTLHEKPVFSVSHTQGFLHRNFMGKWYPVCENPYMWAHDACRQEIGHLSKPPYIQMLQIDPFFKGHYINSMHGDLLQLSDNCYNSSAIYVMCQDHACGTRVQTKIQMLRESAKFKHRHFGWNKRDVSSIILSQNQASIETPSPEYDEDNISGSKPKLNVQFNNSDGEIRDYLAELSNEFDTDRKENIMKRAHTSFSGEKDMRAESRVVGGKLSEPAAWPWMVAIFRDGRFFCGGVVINHRWILSAAHCVNKFWERYYEVRVGMLRKLSFSPQEQNHKVTHVIVNQDYNRADMSNDLTLLRVAPALQFSRWVRPVCLPNIKTAGPNWMWGPPPGTLCVAVGWGVTAENGPDPDHMREVEVPIWKQCIHRGDRAGRDICAGLEEGGKDTCQGDSGGPLLCRNPANSEQWYMAGIVSHGEGCARKGEPGVYTRVSMYIDWIYFNIGSQNLPILQPKQECPGFNCVSGIPQCLPKKRRCDKIVHCLNGEDEVNCNYIRSADDDNKSLLTMTTANIQNETQIQSTKTGDTTQINSQSNPSNYTHTTPQFEDHPKERKLNGNNLNTATATAPVPTETMQESFQSFNKNRQNEQTNQALNFERDTEDLISERTNTLLVPSYNMNAATFSNENTKKPSSKEFKENKSTFITTEVNLVDDSDIEGLDVDVIIDTIHNKVAAVVVESEFEKNKKPTFQLFEEITVDNQSNEESFSSSSSEETFTSEPMLITQIPINRNNFDIHSINILSNTSKVEVDNKTTELPQIFLNGDTFTEKFDLISHDIHALQINKTNENNHIVSPNNNKEHAPSSTDASKTKDVPNMTTEKYLPISIVPGNKTFGIDISPQMQPSATTSSDITTPDEQGKTILPNKTNVLNIAHAKRKILRPSYFQCLKITQVIQSSLRCNNRADCEDGTDELGCTCIDYLTTFNPNRLCDGIVDCADGNDEIDCYTCDPAQFLCKWSKTCISFENVCDGKINCPDGEDELDCYALTNGKYMEFDVDGRPHINLQGFLTIRHQMSWNVVCEDNVDNERQEEAATHICHYLGFSGFSGYKAKHINLHNERHMRSKRAMKSEPIQFVYQSSREDFDNLDSVLQNDYENIIQDPVVLPNHCVPNVTKTCITLFVTCQATLNSEISSHKLIPTQSPTGPQATIISNEISKQTTEYLWPWAAKLYVEGEYRCTGVLVDLSWVLISGSCLWDTLLNKDFVCVILGSKRPLVSTNGPYEQVLEVDAKKDIYESQVTLVHLKEPGQYSRMVKPLVLSPVNMHRSDSETCVTVGQGLDNQTVTVLFEELDSDCGRKNKCFVRHGPANVCLRKTYPGRPWAGIINCKGANGGDWYPAATYKEPHGECGFQGHVAAFSLAHIRTDIKDIITSKNIAIAEYVAPVCTGVRCARGACVPLARACDRVNDCEDGRDELDAACEMKNKFCLLDPHDHQCACNSGQLKCRNGRCVPKQAFANGRDDCGDGSDEPPRATCAQYLSRVAPHRLCDGRLHCFDRSDEDPNYCKCFSTRTHQCSKSGTCVAVDLVCDGVRDCPQGEDEISCMGLAAPEGTPYGTGEVLERQFGVWHTKCYRKPNHTRSELERICRDLGFISGHALLVQSNVLPSMNPNTNVEVDEFTKIVLNDQTTILLRNNDRPMARAVVDEIAENCYPVFIECM